MFSFNNKKYEIYQETMKCDPCTEKRFSKDFKAAILNMSKELKETMFE